MLVGGQGEIDPAMKSMSRMAERLGQSTEPAAPENNQELRMSPNPLVIGAALLALATMVAVFRSRRGRLALPALIGSGLACGFVVLARYDLEGRMRERLAAVGGHFSIDDLEKCIYRQLVFGNYGYLIAFFQRKGNVFEQHPAIDRLR